uniref:Pesticidal crystal protein Cry22Aa Ig-like domain-containing protein n=1 Tax=Listeria ivanovii TaxID=1638 RepID=A0A7T0MAX6_LISIV|nr:immunoglobulin-like domain-containing protein [Listeria ivanovii]QPL19493.1 hypothetical protein pLIS600291c [Listeria ivanovii]UCK61624.1 DUF5011 domain-containing protein [Listeria ivanovii]
MEKKKHSKKLLPFAVFSSLAVFLVAGGIFAYTGMDGEEVTKKESPPKTSMKQERDSEKQKNIIKEKTKKNPTLGTIIDKVDEKSSSDSLVSSSEVDNSPVNQILQTLAKVPDKVVVATNEMPTKGSDIKITEKEEAPENLLPETPESPETPIIPIPTPTPEEPVQPEQPEVPVIVNEGPSIEAVSQVLSIGSSFNAADYATANDKEDGDITDSIQVIANNVNMNEEGTYQVTYRVTDSQGAFAEITISITIVNDRPEIIAQDQQVSIGDDFNPLTVVRATDSEDGDITNAIQVIENNVDTTKAGTYQVTYSVVDSHGKAANQVTIQVIVINDLPTITATNKTILVGDIFDPLADLSANDKQDGDLTSEIRVISNDVDTNTPGKYNVSYEVTDQNGGSTSITIIITVEVPQN